MRGAAPHRVAALAGALFASASVAAQPPGPLEGGTAPGAAEPIAPGEPSDAADAADADTARRRAAGRRPRVLRDIEIQPETPAASDRGPAPPVEVSATTQLAPAAQDVLAVGQRVSVTVPLGDRLRLGLDAGWALLSSTGGEATHALGAQSPALSALDRRLGTFELVLPTSRADPSSDDDARASARVHAVGADLSGGLDAFRWTPSRLSLAYRPPPVSAYLSRGRFTLTVRLEGAAATGIAMGEDDRPLLIHIQTGGGWQARYGAGYVAGRYHVAIASDGSRWMAATHAVGALVDRTRIEIAHRHVARDLSRTRSDGLVHDTFELGVEAALGD